MKPKIKFADLRTLFQLGEIGKLNRDNAMSLNLKVFFDLIP